MTVQQQLKAGEERKFRREACAPGTFGQLSHLSNRSSRWLGWCDLRGKSRVECGAREQRWSVFARSDGKKRTKDRDRSKNFDRSAVHTP
jgi:hypothetical protein